MGAALLVGSTVPVIYNPTFSTFYPRDESRKAVNTWPEVIALHLLDSFELSMRRQMLQRSPGVDPWPRTACRGSSQEYVGSVTAQSVTLCVFARKEYDTS